MTTFFQLVASLREQMNATLSRSDVLRPLGWLIGILSGATVLTTISPWGSDEMAMLLFYLLAGSVVIYGILYLYFALTNPDALRSESYSLQKMAIEHRLIGDSETGLFASQEASPDDGGVKPAQKQIEHDK